MLHFQPGILKYIQFKGYSFLNHKIFRWWFQSRKFCFSICCKIVVLMPSKANICKASIFLKRFENLDFCPKSGRNKMAFKFQVYTQFLDFQSTGIGSSCWNKMHVLELQCHFWEDCGYTEGISQHDLEGKMVKKPEKERSKTARNARSVFAEIVAWPTYLHPFTLMAITPQVTRCFPALGSSGEIISPWQIDFHQFFPVCWPEPEFSLMLNINIQTLLHFSPCINKASTGRG